MKNAIARIPLRRRNMKMSPPVHPGQAQMIKAKTIITQKRRIAMNEIKIVIEGLNELTEAVKTLVLAVSGGTGQTGTQQIPVQTTPASGMQTASVPVAAQQQTYGQMPVQQAPAAMAAQQTAVPVTPVPTTAMAQEYTLEQLQVAAAGLSSMGKMPQVMGILQQFGIQAMTELPRERYGEFATALREAGAQI